MSINSDCRHRLLIALMLTSVGLCAPRVNVLAADNQTIKSVLAQADQNGNGRVEDDEWSGVPEVVRSRLAEAERENQIEWSDVAEPDEMAKAFENRMVYVFDYYDRDDDGRLDSDESRRIDRKHTRVISQIDLDRTISRNRFVDYYCRIAVGLEARVDRVRERVTLDLPVAYLALDADEDGQIGYYEWPRSERLEFFFLDVNEDGFLTPRELTPPESEEDDSDEG